MHHFLPRHLTHPSLKESTYQSLAFELAQAVDLDFELDAFSFHDEDLSLDAEGLSMFVKWRVQRHPGAAKICALISSLSYLIIINH